LRSGKESEVKLEQLANLASLALSAAKDVSPRRCLDKLRRHLMYFMCAEDKFELTGTIEDFGGKERRTSDLAKLVFACFEFAEVLKIDLAGALKEKYDGSAKPAAAEETSPAGQGPAASQEGGAPQGQPESAASHGNETAAPAGAGGVKQPSESGTAPADAAAQSKEELLAMYRKFFAEATNIELVESAWKKEISAHKVLDGKDKGSLYKDYADAKKRLAGK
jgi:hypothetical protein